MRGWSLLLAGVVAATLAGCTTTPDPLPADPAPALATASDGLLMARTSCAGFNGFSQVDANALRPFVPANWTFTAPAAGDLAILRLHTAGCRAPEGSAEDWTFHLMLSTPMVPDAASLQHHDNPDVVIALFTDNQSSVDAWTAAGFPATLATFDWAEDAIGDVVAVDADAGPVLALRGLNPHQEIPTSPYAWPAAYAAGTSAIAWAWGHENATTRAAAYLQQDYGAGAPVPELRALPYSLSVWLDFGVRYALGTPP